MAHTTVVAGRFIFSSNRHGAHTALAGARMPLASDEVVLVCGTSGLGNCNGSGERVSNRATMFKTRRSRLSGSVLKARCSRLGVQNLATQRPGAQDSVFKTQWFGAQDSVLKTQ